MRLSFMIVATVAVLSSPSRAQLISQPSGQGGVAPSSPAAPTTGSSVLTTPGLTPYQSTTPLPPPQLNGLVRPPAPEGREQPERPTGPLR
jgi:hypothetical protein